MTTNHPANGPVSLERLHQIREHLLHDTQYSNGGNRAYILADVLKVIDGAIAAFDAEPVAYIFKHPAGRLFWALTDESNKGQSDVMPVYAAPRPAPLIPDEMAISDDMNLYQKSFAQGHNACRGVMLQGTDGKPELTVWYGSMPETNGKTNWTAMLHRKGLHPWEGITIDCSEYPDRVRYEADRMRHLIGELADEPDILAYDADAHSGYVNPGNSPVTPDDVLRMDWLVSKTVDVREPMVYGSHSIFWSQTITDEDDDYHATKLREQIDAAMAAEQHRSRR